MKKLLYSILNIIVNDINIGNNVAIRVNSAVLESLLSHVVIAGVPANIIRNVESLCIFYMQ